MTAQPNSSSAAKGMDDTLRKFSETSKQQLQTLRSRLGQNPPVGDDMRAVLNRIWSEASFLGCPAIARLSRSLMPATSSTPDEAGQETIRAVSDALDALEELLDDPSSPALVEASENCRSVLQGLAPGLHRATELSCFQEVSDLRRDIPVGRTGDVDHTDVDIYSSDALNGMEWCSREETWIVSQIASTAEDLAKTSDEIRPAYQLMRILSGHRFFSEVDRVCMVGLMPHSNQLVVVDSCLHPRMREQSIRNRMVRGYSCMVDPNGSLSKMRPGVLRVFADSEAVLESFAREGKPAQRSIAYIAESGLRSGICLAIGRGESVQGFLFLNSRKPDYFRTVMRDYGPLLSLFSLLGTVTLDGAGFHADKPPQDGLTSAIPRYSERFSEESFATYFATMMRRYSATECRLELNVQTSTPFLYTPASVLETLCEMLVRLGLANVAQPSSVTLEVELKGEDVLFRAVAPRQLWDPAAEAWRHEQIGELSKRLVGRPLHLELSDRGAALRVPFEVAYFNDGKIRYSVAY